MFSTPTAEEIEALLCRHFKQFTVAGSVNLRTIAKGLVGFSHADIERIAQESIKETILGEAKQVSALTLKAAVERQHQRRAITTLEDSGIPPVSNAAKKRSTGKLP
jgi:AAA+ superfamily predicted ATPase